MDAPKLDFSDLVFALQDSEEEKANELLEELLPRLIEYLRITMNATEADAEECVHQAFFNVYEHILQDNIQHEKYIFSYLLRACKHEYIRYSKHQHRFNSPIEDNPEHFVEPAGQIEKLLDEDRQRILSECLDELEDSKREFIEYFIDKPDASTEDAKEYFGFSSAKIRTKKSRILSRLHHCYKRKWENW